MIANGSAKNRECGYKTPIQACIEISKNDSFQNNNRYLIKTKNNFVEKGHNDLHSTERTHT